MRCYFTFEDRFLATQPIEGVSDDDAIAMATIAFYERIDAKSSPICDGFDLWDGMRLVHRHASARNHTLQREHFGSDYWRETAEKSLAQAEEARGRAGRMADTGARRITLEIAETFIMLSKLAAGLAHKNQW